MSPHLAQRRQAVQRRQPPQKGQVHALAIDVLRRDNFATEGPRSKDWAEVATPQAPKMDFVLTVCDRAAAEV